MEGEVQGAMASPLSMISSKDRKDGLELPLTAESFVLYYLSLQPKQG